MSDILVPNCRVFTGTGNTWRDLCVALIDWFGEGGLAFLTLESTSSSDNSYVHDRALLRDVEGGQIWVGHVPDGGVGILLDPEAELLNSDEPIPLTGSVSHLRVRNEGDFDGKFIFIEYPDSLTIAPMYNKLETQWIIHGGRTITTWSPSYTDKGITGHAIFTARRGSSDDSYMSWGGSASGSSGYSYNYTNNYSIRVGTDEWKGTGAAYYNSPTPSSIDAVSTNYPIMAPTTVGPTGVPIGFTRYMRQSAGSRATGLVRASYTTDQAWVCLSDASGGNSWYLWDRQVDPNIF